MIYFDSSALVKRYADSVHLSSALWLRNAVKEDVIFVASDINLLNAAQSERLQIIDPQKGES